MKHPVLKKLSAALSLVLRFLLIALTLWLLYVALFEKEWIETFLKAVEKFVLEIGNWNYLLAFVFSVVESFPVIGTMVPGMQVLLLVGGFFGREHLLEMIAVTAVWAVIGNFVGYAIGRRYGKAFFREYGDIFGIGKTELGYLQRQIAKNGAWFIVLGKFHNFARAFVPFIAGSGDMHPKRFWAYNIAGSILWSATIITLGIAFAAYYRTILDFIGYVLLGIAAAFAAYVAIFRREAFLRYLEEKRLEIEEKERSDHSP